MTDLTGLERIRNFSIIAHIDHGKSTLADRLLEQTGTVPSRSMRAQFLDSMDLERERGITIKLKPIRMDYRGFSLNLIDTPGHVDFSYEVSRSLAAVEGVVLLVDATQGVEAQTLANLYQAIELNLAVIPVLNKIDLPNADPERVRRELANVLGVKPGTILAVSAKTGQGVAEILERVVSDIPPPAGDLKQPARALIFDSAFDEYRGVVTSVRVVDGSFQPGQSVVFKATREMTKILEVGHYGMKLQADQKLAAGAIGYLVTGLKDIQAAHVGDTVTDAVRPGSALPGYRALKPMVFASIFPRTGDDFNRLRQGIMKLKLNDAALSYEPEQSPALGFGFRCGFLGLLHLEVIEERLSREFDMKVVTTVPSVAYRVAQTDGLTKTVASPLDLPDLSRIETVSEPWMVVDVVTPSRYTGAVMSAFQERRGRYRTTEYLDADRCVLHYEMPLASLIVDFHDTLKSVTQGYASLNYDFADYQKTDVVRLDIKVADEPVDALARIVYKPDAYSTARHSVDRLKDLLTRQQFEIKIQALIGGQVIAASRIAPVRKDVTARLSGGDVTRKRKLLEKQKRGKRRLRSIGRVELPARAYLSLLGRPQNR